VSRSLNSWKGAYTGVFNRYFLEEFSVQRPPKESKREIGGASQHSVLRFGAKYRQSLRTIIPLPSSVKYLEPYTVTYIRKPFQQLPIFHPHAHSQVEHLLSSEMIENCDPELVCPVIDEGQWTMSFDRTRGVVDSRGA
jgi:hypothetical protein